MLPPSKPLPDRPDPPEITLSGELLRILDANFNRATEGLRVVEDYVRFALNDPHLARLCKQARHDLAAFRSQLPPTDLIAARDTPGDVGTRLTVPSEFRRDTLATVAAASLKRTQQAVRSLEEYLKLTSPQAAADCEQLRYRLYTLERSIWTLQSSLPRLAQARLYVLLDGRSTPQEFSRLARQLVDAGADMIQLRDKELPDRDLLERALLLREQIGGSPTLLIVNDRPDIAILAAADGVHVGQDELRVADVRRLVGPRMLLGVSTHSLEQARQAVVEGADYLGCGPVFPSTTKHFDDHPGLGLLKQVADEVRLPTFAIGGITLENLGQVLQSGITRVAVRGAILDAPDAPVAVRSMIQRLRENAR